MAGIIHDWLLNKERITDNGGGGGTPAGASGYIQFNDAGAFGADALLNWDKTTGRAGIGIATGSLLATLTVGGTIELRSAGTTGFQLCNTGAPFCSTLNAGGGGNPNYIANWDILGGSGQDLTKPSFLLSMRPVTDTIELQRQPAGGGGFADLFSFDNAQNFYLPNAYNSIVGGTNRDAYIDNNGLVGTLLSALKYKENFRDFSATDIENIFKIPVKLFDFKDKSKGINQLGTIAEEVEKYFPQICSYKYQYVTTKTGEVIDGMEQTENSPVLDEFGNHLKELETVQYSKIGLLALLAVKNLNERLKVLEA